MSFLQAAPSLSFFFPPLLPSKEHAGLPPRQRPLRARGLGGPPLGPQARRRLDRQAPRRQGCSSRGVVVGGCRRGRCRPQGPRRVAPRLQDRRLPVSLRAFLPCDAKGGVCSPRERQREGKRKAKREKEKLIHRREAIEKTARCDWTDFVPALLFNFALCFFRLLLSLPLCSPSEIEHFDVFCADSDLDWNSRGWTRANGTREVRSEKSFARRAFDLPLSVFLSS